MSLTAGIVGLPNVGKSTLFNAITKKNILAANYPFATIDPNVGVVTVPDKRVEVLENMPNDEIADILDELDDDEREKILVNLETEDAEEVKELLKYEDETVGSIMSKDFISFNLDITIGEIIDILRESNPEDEELNSIFIKDEEERVIGIIELKDLILNNGNVKVKEIMDENINSLKHTESINEAVEIASKYDLLAIPVVDNNEVLIGVVNTHDLIDEVLYPMWKKKNK